MAGLTFNLGRLSPSIFTDSSLNIGIGAAPSGSYKFEVTGTAVIRNDGAAFQLLSSSTSAQYQKWSNGGGNYFIGISNSGGGGLLGSQNNYSFCLVTESARDMSFGTNSLPRMTIFAGGSVGINTGSNDAGYQLDVNGTGRFSGATVIGTAATGKIELSQNTGNPNIEIFGGAGSNSVGGSAYYRLRDQTNSQSSLLQINASGGLDFWFQYGGTFYNRATISNTGAATFSGNVGVGATLASWISSAKVLQLNNTAALYAPTSEAILSNNVYVNSADSNIYLTSDYASQYRQVGGQHLFYSAASGTAGNTISFGSPKLTIASTGAATFSGALTGTTADFETTSGTRYLQIRDAGTSTPSIRSVNNTIAQLRHIAIEANTISLRTGASSGLTVTEALAISATGAATFSSSVTAASGLFKTDQNAYTWSRIDNQANNASAYAGLQLGTYGNSWGIVMGSSLANSNSLNFVIDAGGTNASKMTITSGGNVGIGTSSPQSLSVSANQLVVGNGSATQGLTIYTGSTSDANIYFANGTTGTQLYNGAIVYNHSSNYMIFATNGGTERMRITNGGYLKVGGNSGSTAHEFYGSINGYQTSTNVHTGSNPYGMEVNFANADPNNATNWGLGFYAASPSFVWIYRIYSNGTVAARSDARWKKNIETTRNGYLEDLCKLRVVKYNWYNHEEDTPKELGLIAQEVEEVFPNLVQYDKVTTKKQVEQEDGTFIEQEFEDGESRSVKISVLPFMLLKAIQEQQKQIEELKQIVATINK